MTPLNVGENGISCRQCGENKFTFTVTESKPKNSWVIVTKILMKCHKCNLEIGMMEWSPQGKFYRWKTNLIG